MFYFKLAWNNLQKSLSVFAPFLMASTVLFMLNCIVFIIVKSPAVANMRLEKILLEFSSIVLILFSIIMEIYSYRFLLTQRTRELGLYNILGMNKKQITGIAILELLVMFIGTLIIGSLFSAIFSHVFYLVFINISHIEIFELSFSLAPFLTTGLVFLGIFILLAIISAFKVRQTSPLMLLHDQSKGEKEPKGNLLLAILSIIALSTGYYISLSSFHLSAFASLSRFFVAVICVIFGTYLFFISFIAWYLKRRRQNKQYFYQLNHFVTTSQMIFRMKQNAVGLANITLLAVMAFVAIATTTALYTNTESMANQLFPKTTRIIFENKQLNPNNDILQETGLDKLEKPLSDFLIYRDAMIAIKIPNTSRLKVTKDDVLNPNISDLGFVYVVPQDDFRALGNSLPKLQANETAFFKLKGDSRLTEITLLGHRFNNIANLKSVRFPPVNNTYNPGVLVVSDASVLKSIQKSFTDIEGVNVEYLTTVLADLTKEEISQIVDQKGTISKNDQVIGELEFKEDYRQGTYSLSGVFLFSGFFLGLSFILGAALIIYYKQYSEGQEDQKSYQILQEVGMSSDQVKKTINSQIMLVFFMPIMMAVTHFCFALPILKQMLLFFAVENDKMVYLVSAITISIIIVIYLTIYKITSKTYYTIIER